MASRAKQIADSVALFLNGLTLPVDMPVRTPFAKVAVAPNIQREADPNFGCYVVILNASPLQGAQPDRCGTRWATSIGVIIIRRFDEYDLDQEQPSTLAEIDKCIENAEFIRDELDSNPPMENGTKNTIDHTTLVDDEWLRAQSVFLSQISLTYI